jgi:transposase-like protein
VDLVGSPQEGEVIYVGKKGKRYSPRFQFQVVLEVLKGDRDAVEIARAHDLHPTTVARWKREFLENGAAVFGKDTTLAAYEKKIKEMERLLGRKEVEIALLQNFMDGSS